MFKWLNPINWGIVKIYRDFENYLDWVKTIKREESNPRSSYNEYKLQRTKLFDLYITVSLEQEDKNLPETIQRVKVLESLNPIHKYLDEKLGFADCLNCEFNQYEDENKQLTLTYLIVYRFRFNKFSIVWILKNILIWGLIIFFVNKFNLVSWILSLI